MSKISRDKKKAEEKTKLKGKKAKTATAKKTKKDTIKEESKETKPSIPNYGMCCTCKTYAKFPDGCGHMCKTTKKPTPRKATCNKYNCKA